MGRNGQQETQWDAMGSWASRLSPTSPEYSNLVNMFPLSMFRFNFMQYQEPVNIDLTTKGIFEC
jgi:hypothetical protein